MEDVQLDSVCCMKPRQANQNHPFLSSRPVTPVKRTVDWRPKLVQPPSRGHKMLQPQTLKASLYWLCFFFFFLFFLFLHVLKTATRHRPISYKIYIRDDHMLSSKLKVLHLYRIPHGHSRFSEVGDSCRTGTTAVQNHITAAF